MVWTMWRHGARAVGLLAYSVTPFPTAGDPWGGHPLPPAVPGGWKHGPELHHFAGWLAVGWGPACDGRRPGELHPVAPLPYWAAAVCAGEPHAVRHTSHLGACILGGCIHLVGASHLACGHHWLSTGFAAPRSAFLSLFSYDMVLANLLNCRRSPPFPVVCRTFHCRRLINRTRRCRWT